MKKVIFLDFDGVLNTLKYQEFLKKEGKKTQDELCPLFDPEAVNNLKVIVDAVPTANIVINSTWKYEGKEWIDKLWRKRSLPGRVHSVTPCYQPDFSVINLEEIPIEMLAGKGYDIKQWIDKYAPSGCQYVILEDDDHFLPEQLPHLIQINDRVGLTEKDAVKAIDILNGIF